MEVSALCFGILCFISTVQISITSVNTSRKPSIKSTSQSSNNNVMHTSDKVVDGCTNQSFTNRCCAHTQATPVHKEAWWQIDLSDKVVIEYVNIFYRDDSYEQKQRFGGYQIYQSNTTEWRNSHKCYTDTTSTQGMMNLVPVIRSCTGSAQYLTIYVDRRTRVYDWYSTQAILELCEVEVYGCPVGTYGDSICDSICDTTCINSLCHPDSGQCTYCAVGFYKSGIVCIACPQNCLNDVCDVETGVCVECEDRFFGIFCTPCSMNCADPVCDTASGNCSPCVSEYHGDLCDQPCSDTCKDRICDQGSGVCGECEDRFFGHLCTSCSMNCVDPVCDKASGNCSPCANGYHGHQCDLSCPNNCKDTICYQETGVCRDCEDRFFGPFCTPCSMNCADPVCDKTSGNCSPCRNGYHGIQCTQTCSVNCLNNTCNQNDGQCLGCDAGYHGSMCFDECPINCNDSTCIQNTGNCAACRNGYHGIQCTQTCSVNCLNNTCNQNDGQCLGCDAGYHGSMCFDECPINCNDSTCIQNTGNCAACRNGYHGIQCTQTCSVNCLNNTCNQNDGQCLGCDAGYHGSMCFDECPINCNDSTCIQNTGNCAACNHGYHGDKCAENCTSNCLDNVCNQTSGQCTECVSGYFTTECNRSCPSNCKEESHCDRISGECPECRRGFHGSTCDDMCPSNCKDNTCSQDNSDCTTGCDAGYHGSMCLDECPIKCNDSMCIQNTGNCEECPSGLYGLKCQRNCGQCSGVSCNMTNGACECSDGWEGETCLTRKAKVSASEDQTGVHAGAGVGAVIGIALVVIATVLILKRRTLSSYKESPRDDSAKKDGKVCSAPKISKRQNTYDQQPMESTSSANANENGLVYVNLHDIDLTTEDEVVYNNVDVTSVPVHELRSIIDRKMPNKAVAFQEEFKTFPWGAVHPHEAGKKVSNKPKNRFKTTFPYDHSRIILETIGNDIDTTYTNANYINSVETTKRYIASQGPKPNTLDDFWRMVWQVSSGKIVMLTNIMEGGIVKCHKYWPDEGEPLSTQTFHLKLDREMTYAFYVIRDISIVQKKTKQERQVQQFHFTTWPDHGTPDTLELVLFHRRVTSYATQLTGQMVVHCSAGIGRTGTFIGLDALFNHGKNTRQVDIPRYIRTMRKDRMNMIQTYEQYIALHELLVEGFNLQDSHISRTNFPAVLTIMCPSNKPANQTKTHQEFKALQTFTPSYTPNCFKAAMLKVNKDKNRNMDILAVDKFRAYLQSQPADRTDYINAVVLQSHTSKSGYLMTQFPLEDTVDDFWTMVCDYSCENIVVLGQPSEECWFREDVYSTPSGAFLFKKLNERSMITDVTITDYQVTGERYSNEPSVRIFTMPQWSSDSLLPPSDSSILQLLEQLDSRRRSDNTKPVVVMCRDGCTQSGLFCCISNIRDQMKMDEEVDIFQTARQLKYRRPEAMGNVKQYQYCYNILGQYLDSTEVYMN